MNPTTRASREYLKNAVMTASQEQLQMMLYDGAIRFALNGKEALERKDFEGVYNGFERAQRIVLELNNGMRREINPDLVDKQSALYDFIYRRLIDASVQHDTKAADDALRILRHMRETWSLLIAKLAKESAATVAQSPQKSPSAPVDDAPPSFSIEG